MPAELCLPSVAASSTHLSPAMPGLAVDARKVPFRNATKEIRPGVEGSQGGCGGGQERPDARGQRQNIVWRNVVLMSLLHLAALYSLVLIPKAKPLTLLWGKSRWRSLVPGHCGKTAPVRAGSPVGSRLCGAPSALPSPFGSALASPSAPRPAWPAVARSLGPTGISVEVFSTSASPLSA